MQEPPVALIRTIGVAVKEMVASGVADHEHRMHPRRIRPRRTEPILVEPYANDRVDDETLARGVELMQTYGYAEWQAAAELEIPLYLFQREVREYVRCLHIALHARLT